MAVSIPNASINAMCNALVDLIDAGTGIPTGAVEIRTAGGTTLLATLLMANPAFGAAAAGVATAATIADGSIVATGTAAIARLVDRDGVTVFEMDVGTSGVEMIFDTVAFVSGATASLTSGTITVPGS